MTTTQELESLRGRIEKLRSEAADAIKQEVMQSLDALISHIWQLRQEHDKTETDKHDKMFLATNYIGLLQEAGLLCFVAYHRDYSSDNYWHEIQWSAIEAFMLSKKKAGREKGSG